MRTTSVTLPPAEPPAGDGAAAPAPPRRRPRKFRPAWRPLLRATTAWVIRQLRAGFRLPDQHTPPPHPGRLAGICGWAAALGLLGLPIAGRCSVAIITGTAPGWFEPTVVALGTLGILLTIAAFAAIHRRRLPWLLLAVATAPLAANLLLTLRL